MQKEEKWEREIEHFKRLSEEAQSQELEEVQADMWEVIGGGGGGDGGRY